MKRISDDMYTKHYKDCLAMGLRIYNNNAYILGIRSIRTDSTTDSTRWFPYKIHTYLPKNRTPVLINMENLIATSDITPKIPWNELKKTDKDAAELLSLIKNHERNNKHDKNDHDIFIISNPKELSEVIDVLRDGDYLFV